MANLTPDQAASLALNLTRELVRRAGDFEVMAANGANAIMKRRIFNEGRRIDGGRIGSYRSSSYIAKRKARGRQTSKIDLQFSDRLFRSIGVGKAGRHTVVGVRGGKRSDSNQTNGELSRHLEDRYGPIFGLNDQETTKALKPIHREINRIIQTTAP